MRTNQVRQAKAVEARHRRIPQKMATQPPTRFRRGAAFSIESRVGKSPGLGKGDDLSTEAGVELQILAPC